MDLDSPQPKFDFELTRPHFTNFGKDATNTVR